MANNKLKDEMTDRLFDAMLLLRDREEYYMFFEDLCTISEIKSMAQRLEVASMLQEGRTYEDIMNHTSVSTATIARVKRSLDYGAEGYRLVFSKKDKGRKVK